MLRFKTRSSLNCNVPYFVHRARPLSCPGCDLKGVKLLQSFEDAKEIHNSCVGHRVVVIGASFIGNTIFGLGLGLVHLDKTRLAMFVFDQRVDVRLSLKARS